MTQTPNLHADTQAILRQLDLELVTFVAVFSMRHTVHPTNVVAMMMAGLARELTSHARQTDRVPAAQQFVEDLRLLINDAPGLPPNVDRISQRLNASILKLVGGQMQ